MARAPQEVVEKERARVAEGRAQILRLEENLKSLSQLSLMKKFTVYETTTLALMLGMIFVLSMLEGMFPPLPFHMRFGLSNVVTMYALFFMGRRAAFTLAAL